MPHGGAVRPQIGATNGIGRPCLATCDAVLWLKVRNSTKPTLFPSTMSTSRKKFWTTFKSDQRLIAYSANKKTPAAYRSRTSLPASFRNSSRTNKKAGDVPAFLLVCSRPSCQEMPLVNASTKGFVGSIMGRLKTWVAKFNDSTKAMRLLYGTPSWCLSQT